MLSEFWASTCAGVYGLGQDEAIHEIVRTYQTYLTGLSWEGRPIETSCSSGYEDKEETCPGADSRGASRKSGRHH